MPFHVQSYFRWAIHLNWGSKFRLDNLINWGCEAYKGKSIFSLFWDDDDDDDNDDGDHKILKN